jgi:hypothetical protein
MVVIRRTPKEALAEMDRSGRLYAHAKKLELQREFIKDQYRKGNVKYSNEDAAIDLAHDYKNNFCKYALAVIKENDTLSRQHDAVLNDRLTKAANNNDRKEFMKIIENKIKDLCSSDWWLLVLVLPLILLLLLLYSLL